MSLLKTTNQQPDKTQAKNATPEKNRAPSKLAAYDIIIAGGGMTGATAAIGLAQLGLTIALIEPVKPELSISPSFDQRAVALSSSSVAIYQSLGIWHSLGSIASPIKHISVSDQGQFGFTRLNAKDYQLASLGEVIPLDEAGPILWQAMASQPNIDIFCPAKVISLNNSAESCLVTIQQEADQAEMNTGTSHSIQLETQLLIVADGTYSPIAKILEIDFTRETYGQHAVIANIVTEQPHNNRAYERFTASGPLALLPLTDFASKDLTHESNRSGSRMSLVWCHKAEEIESIMALSDQQFSERLQQAFGYRLGEIKRVGKRFEYPLSLHLAQKSCDSRVLLLGNSAHTIHPIAGQGFNLGLRDIANLIEQIELALASGDNIGSAQFLNSFIASRQSDWQLTIKTTDALARLFSNQFLPLVLIRNQAMNIVNKLPFMKNYLATAAMGKSGRASRLARGIKIDLTKDKPAIPRADHE